MTDTATESETMPTTPSGEQVGEHPFVSLRFAYKAGNNPWGDRAYYSCGHCGLEAHGEDIGYIGAGTNYANGEFAPCPSCGEENSIDRDSKD